MTSFAAQFFSQADNIVRDLVEHHGNHEMLPLYREIRHMVESAYRLNLPSLTIRISAPTGFNVTSSSVDMLNTKLHSRFGPHVRASCESADGEEILVVLAIF